MRSVNVNSKMVGQPDEQAWFFVIGGASKPEQPRSCMVGVPLADTLETHGMKTAAKNVDMYTPLLLLSPYETEPIRETDERQLQNGFSLVESRAA
jgi:hypothetical protein